MFAKDTTRLRRFQKADSFPQRPRVCFYLLPFLWFLPFCVLLLLLVELSYAPPPGLQQSLRPMSRAASVVARDDVCRARVGRAGRAISFLDLVFAFALPIAFLEKVDLHPIVICARSISSSHGRIRSKVSGRVKPLQQSCSKSGTVGDTFPTANYLFLRKNRCQIHDHCVIDCICQRSSRSAFPFSDIQLPGSQA